MNGLSLCAGVGGIDLGLRLAVPKYRTVCFVEVERFPQDVLLARMEDGVIECAPIWGDIKCFDAAPWRGLVDVVHGGYPCQPFSVAGKRLGEADPRHLWPDVARVVRDAEPEWCFFENVAGHLRLGFDVVARDLVDMGYRVAAGLFTAEEVGAPHRRQRLFILANARCSSAREATTGQPDDTRRAAAAGSSGVGNVGDAECSRRAPTGAGTEFDAGPESQAGGGRLLAWPPGPEARDAWRRVGPALYPAVIETQPAVRRVADGAPRRVDRLKALGNGVVPDVAALAWVSLAAQLKKEN